MTRFILFLAFGLFLGACSSTKSTSKTKDKVTRTQASDNLENISLVNYLRKIPGLRVSGDDTNGSVQVLGGGGGLLTSNQPLFVLDGVNIGRSLSRAANMIVVTNIGEIRVLKPGSDASYYGVQGASGVIEIVSKSKKNKI